MPLFPMLRVLPTSARVLDNLCALSDASTTKTNCMYYKYVHLVLQEKYIAPRLSTGALLL